ncbi:hypothetical protein CYMTET_30634 [Cymbomonas tetramitiformis]|uniref:Uncharacterized protein n=1 Tax=Cymbomonas tetramitiformis TaxID=36881 RepID=A0AAE0FJY4_9CHLO|nr:hypothetical protein CYMTET_30634 [Cymbomonas tetramitiformis]
MHSGGRVPDYFSKRVPLTANTQTRVGVIGLADPVADGLKAKQALDAQRKLVGRLRISSLEEGEKPTRGFHSDAEYGSTHQEDGSLTAYGAVFEREKLEEELEDEVHAEYFAERQRNEGGPKDVFFAICRDFVKVPPLTYTALLGRTGPHPGTGLLGYYRL